MPALGKDARARACELIALYPEPRSALIPLCHLAQAQHGWLTPEAMEEIADLLGLSPAEVEGTASFYEMFRMAPTGRYLVSVCTNIACMLSGAYELLDEIEQTLGIRSGSTTADGMFTIEEAECVALCDQAPCIQVNYRFFGKMTGQSFSSLVDDLRAGQLDGEVPPHGVLCRVHRRSPLEVPAEQVARERVAADRAAEQRAVYHEARDEGRTS